MLYDFLCSFKNLCCFIFIIFFFYSVFIFVLEPFIYSDDSYFFKQGLWKEKRLYAKIYCVINLLLVIFGFVVSGLHKIIISYLSLEFIKENNNIYNINEIKKRETINIGNRNYEIEIYPFQNLFLNDKETNKKYEFRKILYNKELYYLKVTNKGLKDQLGWTEFQYYPKFNDGFSILLLMFKFSLAVILSATVIKKFQIDNEYCYIYIRYLFELGYHPKYYKYLDKLGDLIKKINNLSFIIYIILYILFMISLLKRSFFSGFSNIFLSLGAFIISIIVCLINLAFTISSVYIDIYSILSFIAFIFINIKFKDDSNFIF